MSSYKIGLVLDDSLDKADGVQQYVLTLGEWLRKQGHDVHYLVGETTRDDVVGVHSMARNVAMRFNRNRMSMPLPASRRAIKRLLDEERFEVLHVQLPHSPWLAHRIIQEAAPTTAVIGTFHIVPHSQLVRVASQALAQWTRGSLKRFDRIVSVSPAAAEFARQSFGIVSPVVPNAVDVTRFAGAKSYPGKPKSVLRILFLGRLVPRKGCLYLLKAVNQLLQKHPDLPAFQVLVCGKGPLEAELKDFVARHNLADRVSFTGFVSEADKPRYYASADIAVFPSTGGESFGIVLVEAMASGKAAVLAGDNVGYHSVMGGRPELLFAPKNSNELAEKLYQLMTDKTARLTAAQWCKAEAARYDVGVVGAEIVRIYDEALRSRRTMS